VNSPFKSHMILQKSFLYTYLVLKKHLLAMLKSVVLLNIVVEISFSQHTLMNKVQKNNISIRNLCNIINACHF